MWKIKRTGNRLADEFCENCGSFSRHLYEHIVDKKRSPLDSSNIYVCKSCEQKNTNKKIHSMAHPYLLRENDPKQYPRKFGD